MVSINLSASSQSFQSSAYFFWNRGSVSPPQVSLRLEIPLGKVSPEASTNSLVLVSDGVKTDETCR
jgi:hypothetical protein